MKPEKKATTRAFSVIIRFVIPTVPAERNTVRVRKLEKIGRNEFKNEQMKSDRPQMAVRNAFSTILVAFVKRECHLCRENR